ncbi:hypothetical protein LB518_22850 [Mesorhizobium sp. BR1-1-16]|nr:hypothetical protein [Mesorhizobium sp. BR1-1-16]MBZ9939154.1 hypothetical protein [Mesorhizobium sp. BR1-1-16]
MPCAACLRRREAIKAAASKAGNTINQAVTRVIAFPKRVDVRPQKPKA